MTPVHRRWEGSMDKQRLWQGRMLTLGFTVLMVLLLAACNRGGEQQPGQADGGNGGGQIRIGWVAQNFSNPAIVDMVKAGQDEAKKLGNVEVRAEDSQNLEDQISKAETLIAQGVDV